MFKAQNHKRIFDNIPDHPRKFPEEINRLIKEIDLLRIIFPQNTQNIPSSDSQTSLDLLFEMGRGNLSVGRIVEGHINALLLIDTFGTPQQKRKYFTLAEKGALFGIWNTEIPQEKVKLIKKSNNFYIEGTKSFCSGGLHLDFAIVTAEKFQSNFMCLIDLKENQHLQEDWSSWNPIGMRASVSCRIHFSKVPIIEQQILGKPLSYYKEPHFSWGGVRFSAVQVGGAQSILDEVIKDLTKRKRTSDPYQKMRLGKMAILTKTAKFWISEAQKIERGEKEEMTTAMRVHFANMMRSATLYICEEILSIAEKAVGIQGTMMNHPLEQKIRDLRVYLKQAGPDAALASVGDFIAKQQDNSPKVQEKFILEDLFSAPLFAPEQLGKQMGNSFILAPHPDDEALGCAGLIQFLLEQKVDVFVGFMTSGDASHPNSVKYPPEKLAALREQEAIKSCEILGVKKSNIIFFRQSDSYLSELEHTNKIEIATHLSNYLKEFEISSLVLPWQMDPHLDHRASYEIGNKALEICNKKIQVVEYPIWLWKKSSPNEWPTKKYIEIFRLDISSKMERKKNAIYAHTSQTSNLIDDDPTGFILTEDLLSPFLMPYEFYFFKKEENLKSLTKSYFDTLYNDNPDPWNFRTSRYEKQKYQTISKSIKNENYNQGLELGCSIGEHTYHLADHCKSLLAIDVSEDAIATAKKENPLPNVQYLVKDISIEFPKGSYDFISMCEIGYYFNRENLVEIFTNISKSLNEKGHFLMVHWTSFVREYPLSGNKVHQIFSEFNKKENLFSLQSSFTDERYELQLWEKN